jgi:hypothetical protein
VATKKSKKKSTKSSAKPASSKKKAADKLNLPELGAPPETDDPEVMAAYFVEMLEALGEGNPEMKRVRDVLVGCIESFHDNPDKEEAKEIFAARLTGLEEGVAFLLLGNIKKLRDRLVKDSRKLGTGSKVGKAARVGADAFTLFADGLQKLLDAAAASDPELRAEAQVAMKQAHAKMLELEAAAK